MNVELRSILNNCEKTISDYLQKEEKKIEAERRSLEAERRAQRMRTYKTKEAAEILNISPSQLRTMAREGKIAAADIGKGYAFREQVLIDYQLTQEQKVQDEANYRKAQYAALIPKAHVE